MRRAYYIILSAIIALVGLLIATNQLEWKDVGVSALALIGTFIGATLAFRMNEEKEKNDVEERKVQAINSALLVILRQHNALAQTKRDLERYPDNINAALNMPAFKSPNYDDLIHNVAALEFLINSKDPNIILKLTVEQERFHQAIESMNIRNDFYVGELQREVSAKGMNKRSFTAEEAEAILGERVFGTAVNSICNAREHIFESCLSLPAIAHELRVIAKELFPERKFLDYEIPEQPKP